MTEGTSGEHNRRRANVAGQVAATVVALFGLLIILVPVLLSSEGRKALFADPLVSDTVRRTVERTTSDGTSTVETTTEEADQSSLELALAGGGALLLRLGVVAAGSFLAGAVVQRTAMAHFSLELGPIKIPELPEAASASKQGLLSLTARIEAQREQIVAGSEATTRAIQILVERIDVQQRQIDELRGRAGPSTGSPPRQRPASGAGLRKAAPSTRERR